MTAHAVLRDVPVEEHVGAPLAAPGTTAPAEPAADLAAWRPPSWESVVRDHSSRVYRLAYRLTGNQHDAEDLTQEVFIRVFRSLSSYTPGTFEGWLHRITTNLFLDQARRRQRIRMDAMGDDSSGYPARGELHDPVRGYEHANLDHDVQRALDALAPEYRAAVVLCDIEGLSYEEIAVTLGIKLGTVRSRIHRARSQLRLALADRAPRRRSPEGTAAEADGELSLHGARAADGAA
ncbi:RNA polymerase, sigma 29 subunit, SigE [Sanguibacter keddieii DSM 10542]|uniref:RNA polymerase, sigma 29 subunit, SigE n=1 Tax=Sanguibacter keddieii (strain ATCC 51767 / DSM 10542 / NCFB 3025 / ST-74) TaxID=446469 RepID=D1BKL7_SANKS|nr:RNA polymerase, sigma 29 subunit, SigE [Sanguibacter keddieii DSM 10542]